MGKFMQTGLHLLRSGTILPSRQKPTLLVRQSRQKPTLLVPRLEPGNDIPEAREHVRFVNLRRHPKGCGYTNEARQSG
ncbi:MAG TPA: hypothetical protein DD990_09520, partial [Cyanobacteria bacterium UBA11368]|nr:hypothetical protein [Cyanobacteria bacterium UBA11368]